MYVHTYVNTTSGTLCSSADVVLSMCVLLPLQTDTSSHKGKRFALVIAGNSLVSALIRYSTQCVLRSLIKKD